MNTKKNLLVSILALACILFAGAAQASTFGLNGTSLTTFMGDATYTTYTGSLAGSYSLTPVFTETANAIALKSSGTTLFTNWGSWSTTGVSNLAGTTYSISGHPSVAMTNTIQVHIFTLLADTIYNGKTLSVGSLIIGLEDTANPSGGYDFNDFIITATKSSPTPIPAAVWLLGSGLMGIMGLKRARVTHTWG